MTAVTIDVTQADIDNGKPQQACRCPIYLAISRYLREHHPRAAARIIRGLSVSGVFMTIGRGFGIIPAHVNTPQPAADFIGRFDNALPVEPFSFTLDIPADLLEAS